MISLPDKSSPLSLLPAPLMMMAFGGSYGYLVGGLWHPAAQNSWILEEEKICYKMLWGGGDIKAAILWLYLTSFYGTFLPHPKPPGSQHAPQADWVDFKYFYSLTQNPSFLMCPILLGV